MPESIAAEACERMAEFCSSHYTDFEKNNNLTFYDEQEFTNGTNGDVGDMEILKNPSKSDIIKTNIIPGKK